MRLMRSQQSRKFSVGKLLPYAFTNISSWEMRKAGSLRAINFETVVFPEPIFPLIIITLAATGIFSEGVGLTRC